MPTEYLSCSEKNVKCFCPICEKIHIKFIFYTGREKIPKYICKDCKRIKNLNGDIK